MKRLLLILAVLLLAAAFSACGGAQPAAPAATPVVEAPPVAVEPTEPPAAPEPAPSVRSGTLRVALTTSPNALDVPAAAEKNASNASWTLYDSLVWIDGEGRVSPALAESWEFSESGTEVTFKLRQGVVFHNGDPFTADDVVYSWERGKRDEFQFSERWALVDLVEKIDDHTVRIQVAEPNPLLLRGMAFSWAIVPKNYIEAVGETGFANHPVGTGPFMFVSWVRGDRITLEANPNYWREGYPKLEGLVFRPIPESSTRVAAIRTGEVDIVTRLSAEEAASLEGVSGVQVISYPVDRVFYIAFNNLTTGVGQPTESPLVRQAMNYAVDMEAIIDALFGGLYRQSTGYVTPANWGYDETLQPFGYDPERARELLTEAGYPNGFEMDFACPSGAYTNFEQVCEAIQGYLGDVGIRTSLELMESGQYWDLEANKELPPLFGDSWSETSGEALPRLRGALGGWEASFSSWSDPEIDRLMNEISVTMDDNARAALYVELQRYMHENPPFIYLYEPVTFEAISTKVQDYRPYPSEDYFHWTTWLSE